MNRECFNHFAYGLLIADDNMDKYFEKLNEGSDEGYGLYSLNTITDHDFDLIYPDDEDKSFILLQNDGSFSNYNTFEKGFVISIDSPAYFASPYKDIDEIIDCIIKQLQEYKLIVPDRDFIRLHLGLIRWIYTD